MKRSLSIVLLLLGLLFANACAERPDANKPARTADPVESYCTEPSGTASPEPTEEPAATTGMSEPDDDAFVRVLDWIPSIYVELRYATSDNFTGEVIYDFSEAYLRYGTVKKLAAVQSALLEQGYSLKIWDAFRPVSAQFKLWEIVPDPIYVANPNTGHSSHSRGNAVDVTLTTTGGLELEMPTGFDVFSQLADRNYGDVSDVAAENALLLENAMTDGGFSGYSGEWWHFSDEDSYAVADDFTPPDRSPERA